MIGWGDCLEVEQVEQVGDFGVGGLRISVLSDFTFCAEALTPSIGNSASNEGLNPRGCQVALPPKTDGGVFLAVNGGTIILNKIEYKL